MSTKSTKSSKSTNLTSELSQRFGNRVQENCSLAPFVRTKVGGVGEYVIQAQTVEEVMAACQAAVECDRPYVVIGGGTGTLVSHVGALGVVIVNKTKQIHFSESTSLVVVEAGVRNSALLAAAASRGLGGLEFLTGIPGSIGGAIATAATYNQKSLQSFIRALVLWVTDGRVHHVVTLGAVEAEQLLKSYQNQPLAKYQVVILAAHLQFSRLYPEEIMRRLSTYRRRAQLIASPKAVIGTPFTPSPSPTRDLIRAVERIKTRGLRFHWRDQLVMATRDQIQPVEYRKFLEEVSQLTQAGGQALEDRITYLGYWPDEGENAAF